MGRRLAGRSLFGGGTLISVEADDFCFAAAADEYSLPIRRNAIFVVRELANVAPADGGRSAARRIAASVFDIGAIQQVIRDARATQALKIALRRKLVVTNVDLFASFPRRAAGRFI